VDPATNLPLAFDNSDTVTLALGANPSSGTLSGTLTQTVVNGVATFSNLSINQPGNGYTLVASGPGLAAVTSNGFAITSAAMNHLLFFQQPGNAIAGQALSPAVVVEVVDQNGSVMTTDNTDVLTLALGTNPGGGTLSGTLTLTVSAGVATFSNLSIDKAGSGYTLVVSSPGLPPVTSNSFAITPAAADHLLFVQQPTDTAAGQTISPAVMVAVVDLFGNVVTGDNTDTITLSLGVDPSGGTATLGGTLTVTVVNGVATFSDLSLDTSGADYTLHATIGGGVPDLDSNPFNVL